MIFFPFKIAPNIKWAIIYHIWVVPVTKVTTIGYGYPPKGILMEEKKIIFFWGIYNS